MNFSFVSTWKYLAIRLTLLGLLIGSVGFINRVWQNVAAAAAMPTMGVSSPGALATSDPANAGKPHTRVPSEPTFTPTNSPEPTSALPSPTLETSPTDTPAIPTPTSPAEMPTSTPTSQPPAGSSTPLATYSITPTATITGTWITPQPTLVLTATATLPPVDIRGEHVSDQAVVKFKNQLTLDEIKTLASSLQAEIVEEIKELDLWVFSVSPEQLPYLLAALQAHPQVRYAEPNYLARAYSQPDDPGLPEQEYLNRIQAQEAWNITTGSQDIIVAIIDTGVDVRHPELSTKIWNNQGETGTDSQGNDKRSNHVDDDQDGYIDNWQGWNAMNNDGDITDALGHGTHVAGIVAASTNNRAGIAGVSWGALLMPVKVLDNSGSGSYSQVAKAIIYATRHGAQIINLSLGGTSPSELLHAAVDYASTHGSLLVAAAGDTGKNIPSYPAAYEPVIAVGAVNLKNQHARFSSVGEMVDLVAPGVKIYSTTAGGKYSRRSGTSTAAAQVSGVAALLASLDAFKSPIDIRQALLSTAADLGPGGRDSVFGDGLVQSYTALNYFGNEVSPVPTEALAPGANLVIQASLPTATLPPPAPTSAPQPGDPHVHYAPTTDSCAACHRSHTANGPSARFTWPEEQVCFNCHTSNNPFGATNVQPAFTSPPVNSSAAYYKHSVSQFNGVHQGREQASGRFGGGNRHVECEDCHEPHEATRGPANPPFLQRVMNFVSGVDPNWSGAGAPAGYNWFPQAEREYQVCFKCHSSYTALPGYVPDGWNGISLVANGLRKLTSTAATQIQDSRDMAREFNPNNASFHPVAALGRNQSIPAASFVNGWSQASLMYCSDCHNNPNAATQGSGPHGSSLLHILIGSANYTTVDGRRPASGELCFSCHSYATYVTTSSTTSTNFRDGGDNLHSEHVGENTTCYTCHDSHGSEQLHLINFDVSAVTILNGRDSQTAWYETTGGNGGGGCFLACHDKDHNPLTYTR